MSYGAVMTRLKQRCNSQIVVESSFQLKMFSNQREKRNAQKLLLAMSDYFKKIELD